ncbi:MAG: hypothetical protein K2Y37_25690 [Pirellulales bacterium]|nr:hypothetical protein [Pirellulales bacterium]
MAEGLWTTLFVALLIWLVGAALLAIAYVVDGQTLVTALTQVGLSPIEAKLMLADFLVFWPIGLTAALPWALAKMREVTATKRQQNSYGIRRS